MGGGVIAKIINMRQSKKSKQEREYVDANIYIILQVRDLALSDI